MDGWKNSFHFNGICTIDGLYLGSLPEDDYMMIIYIPFFGTCPSWSCHVISNVYTRDNILFQYLFKIIKYLKCFYEQKVIKFEIFIEVFC